MTVSPRPWFHTVGDIVGELHFGLDISATVFEDERFVPLEIRVVDDETVEMGLVDAKKHRMTFSDEQPSTWPEQAGDNTSPTCDVGQPAKAPMPV